MLEYVSSMVSRPLATGKYDAIKGALIATLSESNEKTIRKLPSDTDLVTAPSPNERISKGSDKRRNSQIQTILSVSRESLTTLTVMADRIFKISGQSSTVEADNIFFSIRLIVERANRRQRHIPPKF